MEIKGSCSNYKNFEVVYEQISRWRYKGFTVVRREVGVKSWNLLCDLAPKSLFSWCVLGDFNNMIFSSEKCGGRPHPGNLPEGFTEGFY